MHSASWICDSADPKTAVWVSVSAPVLKHHCSNDCLGKTDQYQDVDVC